MGGPSSGMFKAAAAAAAVHRTHPPMGGAAGTARLAVAEWTTSRSGGRVEAEDDDGPRWASRWLVSGHARVECHSVGPRPSPGRRIFQGRRFRLLYAQFSLEPRPCTLNGLLCALSRCLDDVCTRPSPSPKAVFSLYHNYILSDDRRRARMATAHPARSVSHVPPRVYR